MLGTGCALIWKGWNGALVTYTDPEVSFFSRITDGPD